MAGGMADQLVRRERRAAVVAADGVGLRALTLSKGRGTTLTGPDRHQHRAGVRLELARHVVAGRERRRLERGVDWHEGGEHLIDRAVPRQSRIAKIAIRS